ncbi:MAG: nucleotidyl transferase AbiEii/AbiGii toxin family protein [bacterium]
MITLEKLSFLCNTLNKEGVKYILIGGCAVILHGLERPTYDIDIVIEDSNENITNLKKAFAKFIKEDEIKELTSRMVKKYQVIRVGFDDFYIDIIGKIGDIDYKKAKDDILIERIENIEIPFAGLSTMIELKKGLREIDLKDRLFLEGKRRFLEEKI